MKESTEGSYLELKKVLDEADAVLIGETLMRSGNIGGTLKELREGV